MLQIYDYNIECGIIFGPIKWYICKTSMYPSDTAFKNTTWVFSVELHCC